MMIYNPGEVLTITNEEVHSVCNHIIWEGVKEHAIWFRWMPVTDLFSTTVNLSEKSEGKVSGAVCWNLNPGEW